MRKFPILLLVLVFFSMFIVSCEEESWIYSNYRITDKCYDKVKALEESSKLIPNYKIGEITVKKIERIEEIRNIMYELWGAHLSTPNSIYPPKMKKAIEDLVAECKRLTSEVFQECK